MDEAERLLQRYADLMQSNFGLKSPDIVAEREARDAVLAAMPKSGVPDGWQLVPVEPTVAMYCAAQSCGSKGWANMLAAAPQPPALDSEPVTDRAACRSSE